MKKEEKNRKKDLTNGERCGNIVKLSPKRQPAQTDRQDRISIKKMLDGSKKILKNLKKGLDK